MDLIRRPEIAPRYDSDRLLIDGDVGKLFRDCGDQCFDCLSIMGVATCIKSPDSFKVRSGALGSKSCINLVLRQTR